MGVEFLLEESGTDKIGIYGILRSLLYNYNYQNIVGFALNYRGDEYKIVSRMLA